MSLETKEKEIDGHVYRVSQLPAKKGRKLLVRLHKVFSPSIATVLKDIDAKKGIGDLRLPVVASALESLVYSLDEEDLDYLCDTFAKMTHVGMGGDKWPVLESQFDVHFAGRYRQMFQWLFFCLEVNYSSFFDEWGGIEDVAGKIVESVSSQSPSPKKSTGSSTESPARNDTQTASSR